MIDGGAPEELSAAYTDVDAELERIATAMFRCEVEMLHLVGGRRMLANWRAIRTVMVIEDRPVG